MAYISDQPMRRHDLSHEADNLFDQKKITCYHCQEKSARLTYCELWGVSACEKCTSQLHHEHHKSCRKDIPLATKQTSYGEKPKPIQRTFTVTLTHYSGQHLFMRCQLGQEINMEDHMLGTYIVTSSTMTLVLEDRDSINKAILEGLRSIRPE